MTLRRFIKSFLVVAATTALVVVIGIATFSSSGVENIDLLISVYASLLEASVTVVALVSILISWVVERKINRAWNVLNEMQEYSWMDYDLESLGRAFERMKRTYTICYDNAALPSKWTYGITLIYFPCVVASVLALVTIGYLLPGGSIGHVAALAYSLAAVAIMLSLIAFAFILHDLTSLERGWFFILPHPEDLDLLACLKEKLGLDFKMILKIGLINAQAVLNTEGEYSILLYQRFRDLERSYEPIFKKTGVKKTEARTHRPHLETLVKEKDYVRIPIVKTNFPYAFPGSKKPWELHVELENPFLTGAIKREAQTHGRIKKILSKVRCIFKDETSLSKEGMTNSTGIRSRVRYIFKDETKRRKRNVLTDLTVTQIAYLKPEERLNSYIVERQWVKIYDRDEESALLKSRVPKGKRNLHGVKSGVKEKPSGDVQNH